MKKQLLSCCLAALGLTAIQAQSFNEWKDPEVNSANRSAMHTNYFAFASADEAKAGIKENSANFMTLNGLWKFNWVRHADARPTDFYQTNFNDKGWDDLQVPGVWELNGYGDPIYVNVGYAWRSQFKNNPPLVPTENNHVGSYRKEIILPADWKGKEIFAHFGSVTSNMYLWVNGRYVGYSEDSKLEAEFNLTNYLKPGKNVIAFQVFRWCDGSYLEDQDSGFVPMDSAPYMAAAQRQAAQNSGAAFWSAYDAMQSLGGMAQFVANGWAGKDYTHINFAGGRRVAWALYDAINRGAEQHPPFTPVAHDNVIDTRKISHLEMMLRQAARPRMQKP